MSVLLFIFILSIPALYAAMYKNMFQIKNEKMNNYFLRLFYLAPFCAFVGFFFSAFFMMLIRVLTPEIFEFFMRTFGDLGDFISGAVIVSPLMVILTKIMIIPSKKEIEERQKMKEDYEYYVFMPEGKHMGGKSQGTKYTFNKRKKGEALIGTQIDELTMQVMKGMENDIMFTMYGEFAVNEYALQVFEENKLTGYYKKPMTMKYLERGIKEDTEYVKSVYYQLMASNTLAPMSKETKLTFKGTISTSILPQKNIYYDREVMDNALDFNRSIEYVGAEKEYPYAFHQYWVISKKVHAVFKKYFYFSDDDFMPIILLDSGTIESKEEN